MNNLRKLFPDKMTPLPLTRKILEACISHIHSVHPDMNERDQPTIDYITGAAAPLLLMKRPEGEQLKNLADHLVQKKEDGEMPFLWLAGKLVEDERQYNGIEPS